LIIRLFRVLGVTISFDLSLYKHVAIMSVHPAFIACANFEESDDP